MYFSTFGFIMWPLALSMTKSQQDSVSIHVPLVYYHDLQEQASYLVPGGLHFTVKIILKFGCIFLSALLLLASL